MYTIEKVWNHKGLKCVVLMVNDAGHRSGYVGVPRDNPYFGLYHNRPELRDMNVHGGLTYSSGSPFDNYPIKMPTLKSVWWFGYDCGHFGDGHDLTGLSATAIKIYRDDPYPVRSLDYCIKECETLADQLVSVPEESTHGSN